MKIKNVAVTATTLAAALVLTACGGGEPAGSASPAPTSAAAPAPAAHNQADIAFAQGMIPHHQQAVDMATLATDRAGSDDVRRLATAIEQAQGPEIAQMRGFLTAWGAPESGGMPGMNHETTGHGAGHGGTDHGGTAGMMADEEMRRLEQARGAGFDRMFLEMMIRHHEGAVQMARTELADGADPEAKALAQRVVDTQGAEIAEMRRLLG